jgi:cyclomaltodextrinase / maltogenic alpha-amylase / neopullulanase
MRAQFGALTACALVLVACASTGKNQPVVHPKARKALPPAVVVAPTSAPAPQPQPAPPPPIAAPPLAPSPPPPRALPIVPSIPQAAPPAPEALPSEIPTRSPRRDIPTWNTPMPRAPERMKPTPVPVPVPVAPPTRVAPPPASSIEAPVTVPVLTPAPAPVQVPSPPPPPPPTPAPVIAAPLPPAPPPSARPSASTNTGPLVIDRPAGTVEARLPCNRAASPHCDLRIYQVNVGTFVDGSPDHNPISGYGPGPHTGDIAGVFGALEHIKALGFNTIWLTPIFDSAAGQPQSRVGGRADTNPKLDGTGYFPRNYFKIDPQFGTLEQVTELVDQAHLLGLKVMFDGVFGHHKGAPAPSPTGGLPIDATAPSAYDGGAANYPGRIVNFNDPRSTAFYKEVARYWIDTIGIDGWRLDQVYQVPSAPLREILTEITNASNAQLLSGYVVGEMWGSADQIRAQLGPSNAPALTSAFDFPTRYALVQTLAGDENGATKKPATTINESWAMGAHASYPDHAIMNLMLGNHDLVRFGDLIERAGKGGPSTPTYWALHRMAFTFMAAWSGPITLYYGEEVGAEVTGFAAKVTTNCSAINQCDDHVGRNMVSLPGVNARSDAVSPQGRLLKNYLTALMNVRASTPALSSGSRQHIFSDAEIYIDLKSAGSERYLLVMNVGAAPRSMTITPAALGMSAVRAGTVTVGQAEVQGAARGLSVTIPALGAAIIKVEGQ